MSERSSYRSRSFHGFAVVTCLGLAFFVNDSYGKPDAYARINSNEGHLDWGLAILLADVPQLQPQHLCCPAAHTPADMGHDFLWPLQLL